MHRLPVSVCAVSGLAVLLLSLGACRSTAVGPPVASLPALVLSQETVSWEDGVRVTFERGTLVVPANRSRPSGQTLGVEVVRFRRAADAPVDVPPIVYLQGGPGYGSLDEFLDDSRFYTDTIEPLLQVADVISVSQRGFGSSEEMPCADGPALSADQASDDGARRRARGDALAACRRRWEAAGRDLAGFHVVEAAADVAEAVRALGYERVQLYGKSFGSHHGMAILHAHPGLVARATFGALEGPDQTYDSPDGLLDGLRRIAAEAEASPALAAHVPEGGLLAAYRDLIRRADTTPVPVQTEHPDTDQPVTVYLDGDDFRALALGVTRGLKFRTRMSAWPLDLLDMLNGDLYRAGRRILALRSAKRLGSAAGHLYDCASGISPARATQHRRARGVDMVGLGWEDDRADCEAWDVDLGDAFRTDFVTEVPTVLAHGTWDMNTPYMNAAELKASFRRHHLVTIEGGSHGAMREASRLVEGFEDALMHWLATGDAGRLPERVELPPLAWEAPEAE